MAQIRSVNVIDFSAPKLQFKLEQPLNPDDKERLTDVNPYWRVSKWDMFYFIRPAIIQGRKMSLPSVQSTAARFNTAQIEGVGNVMPCILDYGTTVYALYVPIGYARAQLRRFSPEWRIILSEHYAAKGQVGFVLEEVDPRCSHVIMADDLIEAFCGARPAPHLADSKSLYPLYLCEKHRTSRNHRFAARRAASK